MPGKLTGSGCATCHARRVVTHRLFAIQRQMLAPSPLSQHDLLHRVRPTPLVETPEPDSNRGRASMHSREANLPDRVTPVSSSMIRRDNSAQPGLGVVTGVSRAIFGISAGGPLPAHSPVPLSGTRSSVGGSARTAHLGTLIDHDPRPIVSHRRRWRTRRGVPAVVKADPGSCP